MTSINTSLASYYSLADTSSSNTGSSLLSNSTSSVTTLAQALEEANSSNSSSSNDAYLLSLSSQAQSILSGTGSSSTSVASSTSSTSFTLTADQKTTINKILDKYKDAPFDQETFDEIQNDLADAGLSPTQLSAQDQITSFNPTSQLLGALSGNYAPITSPSSSASTEQTKANNYMQSIISDWESISTTASSSGNGTSTSTTA